MPPSCCYISAEYNYLDFPDFSRFKHLHSQSLIVCGESGSGKTEAAKALMTYLAKTKAAPDKADLSDKVLAVNPILVCFIYLHLYVCNIIL